jgi:hypothetical protein
MVRYTAYRRIYEKFSFLTRPRGQNGRILRPSRAMSGSAGLSPSRNRKPEGSTLTVYTRNLKKECADLVAGQAVRTLKLERVLVFGIIPSHGAAPLFQYQGAGRLLTRHTLPLSFAASFLAGRRACQLNYTLANLGHHSTRKCSD